MAYFQNITSLVSLKKQYRALAKQHHPDRGGSTEAMQQINKEFEVLFKKWEHDTTVERSHGLRERLRRSNGQRVHGLCLQRVPLEGEELCRAERSRGH